MVQRMGVCKDGCGTDEGCVQGTLGVCKDGCGTEEEYVSFIPACTR